MALIRFVKVSIYAVLLKSDNAIIHQDCFNTYPLIAHVHVYRCRDHYKRLQA